MHSNKLPILTLKFTGQFFGLVDQVSCEKEWLRELSGQWKRMDSEKVTSKKNVAILLKLYDSSGDVIFNYVRIVKGDMQMYITKFMKSSS